MALFSAFKELHAAIKDRGMIEELADVEAVMEQMHTEGKLDASVYQAKEAYDKAEQEQKEGKISRKQYQEINRSFMITLKNCPGLDEATKAKVDHIIAEYNEVAQAGDKTDMMV